MPTKTIAWTTGTGNITLTYTGQGDGTILVSSDDNTGAARSQTITIQTTTGTPVVTRNITINQAAYVPPFVSQDFSYTGTVQSCTLPPGTYRLQCWGAQGGSNPSDSTYGISSYDGGKGGYSEAILKLTSATTVYIFVGGQPSTASTNGGWNGGGGGSGTSTNGAATDTNGLGRTKVGRGGGATDIALVTSTMNWSSNRTNRSSASLLSRFIVAGGGSGGAMALKRVSTTTTEWQQLGDTVDLNKSGGTTGTWNSLNYRISKTTQSSGTRRYYTQFNFDANVVPLDEGHYKVKWETVNTPSAATQVYWTGNSSHGTESILSSSVATSVTSIEREFDFNYTAVPASSMYLRFQIACEGAYYTGSITIYKQVTTTTTTDTYDSQVGYAGGGTEGKAYNSTYKATQSAAGSNGEFGYGSNQLATAYRYVGGCGGGGWYGGGSGAGNAADINYVERSGGGSGFVNTNANSSYRPQDYTGIEMDSGNTYDGNISNPSTTDGTFETGHSGNGYARITRMGSWKAELPTGYTLVEYIENVSSAYINTGVNAADDIGIHIEYEDNYTYGSSSNYVVGARASSSSTILIGISGSSSGNTSNISYNGSSVNLGVTRSKGKKYVVDLQADSTGLDYRYVIDGSEAKTGRLTKTLSATSTPICLFGFNSSNIKKNTRISRCYITDGGDVVRYFLPCKNASNVVGLYDCVNGVFYGSSNSYTFTAGPNA